jgi:hypothetical protein
MMTQALRAVVLDLWPGSAEPDRFELTLRSARDGKREVATFDEEARQLPGS